MPERTARRIVPATDSLGMVTLASPSGLEITLLPGGALFAIRHRHTLVNQLLPGPGEEGLFRLMLRWTGTAGRGWAPLTRPGGAFVGISRESAQWEAEPAPGLACATTLTVHPSLHAWAWSISVTNAGSESRSVDVVHGQDLGLADEGTVRNNEAYNSHYIDLLPVRDEALGWVILARQNQRAEGGRHPWLAAACAGGSVAYCTDGWQFFGADHRLTGEPAAAREEGLPSRRLQYECALAGLQSGAIDLDPGASARFSFVVRYLEDHPAASGPGDLERVREILPAAWAEAPRPSPPAPSAAAPSIFLTAPWWHGDRPSAADWADWFPGARRHEERDRDGRLLSFFHGDDTHVVSRDKEAVVLRPHGHILRSGEWTWIDDGQFGITCYAAGIFAAQAYLGNPSLARLLPVVRNALNVTRGPGQRVFVRLDGAWRQLGIPSAFAMTPGEARWIYRARDRTIELRAWCARTLPASFLEARVVRGGACEFLVTHELVLGASEMEHEGSVEVDARSGWAACHPGAATLVGTHRPGACFAVGAIAPGEVAALGGDEMIRPDGDAGAASYLVLRSLPVVRFGMLLTGTLDGRAALPEAVEAARRGVGADAGAARPPPEPFRLGGIPGPAVSRLDDVIPWFNHNAAIHFSAPHGLEQCGGAAWGVRDVTQGSLEWLLAGGRFAVARRMLEVVFAQQYAEDGTWPQWFMHPPFRFLQQTHSHGDVCFWPVKALCDYIEASNDFELLRAEAGYTSVGDLQPAGPREPILVHCDRVVAQLEARFLEGTALVNYGDGDWDDTLQPADPRLRTRMVSAWTVGLAYHTLRQYAVVCRRAGEGGRAARAEDLLGRMRRDFASHLMPGGVVAGFLVREPGGQRVLLHPDDRVTGIRYRLLPMTRSILAELFTPEEAGRHLGIIRRELLFADGARLMSEPARYAGGTEQWFKRADTAANVGREIGLQYVHAHIRYAEALAKVGDAEGLWRALQVVNPVGLGEVLPQAAPRQGNVYFSSSDADFADRCEAAARWEELRAGRVPVRGGWRLYSSGPGLFLNKVRSCLLGVRESFGDIVLDPVLPRGLDGLVARLTLVGRPVEVHYRVRERSFAPSSIRVNGVAMPVESRDPNPYRTGGIRIAAEALKARLDVDANRIDLEL